MWPASERVRSSRCSRCQPCRWLCRLSCEPARRLVDGSIEYRPPVAFGIFVQQCEYSGRLLGFALREIIARFVVGALHYQGVRDGEVQRLQKCPPLSLLLLVRSFQLRVGPLPRLFEGFDGFLWLPEPHLDLT